MAIFTASCVRKPKILLLLLKTEVCVKLQHKVGKWYNVYWNLYEATKELCRLSRQVVFQNAGRINMIFLKAVSGKLQNSYVFY